MNMRVISWLAGFALFILLVSSILTASAASNTVPPSRLTDQTNPITVNDIKPPQCAAFTLTSILVCGSSPTCNGDKSAELIIGLATTNKINGHVGQNCCIGVSGTTYSNCDWHP